jgi:hypothetical protein
MTDVIKYRAAFDAATRTRIQEEVLRGSRKTASDATWQRAWEQVDLAVLAHGLGIRGLGETLSKKKILKKLERARGKAGELLKLLKGSSTYAYHNDLGDWPLLAIVG